VLDRRTVPAANSGERIDDFTKYADRPGESSPQPSIRHVVALIDSDPNTASVTCPARHRRRNRRKGGLVGLSFTVGGAKGTFEGRFAAEVAGVLDHAFGAEENWEETTPRHFGELVDAGWTELQERASAELGDDFVPNLLALGAEGRGVYLPAHVQAVNLPLSVGGPLHCASLPGLRSELAELAEHWELPLDDEGLQDLLQIGRDPDDGFVADSPEVLAFARLALAANEATRRDCPLWVVA
jgi:hypothetical protein